MKPTCALAALALLVLAACPGDDDGDGSADAAPPAADAGPAFPVDRDIVSTDLALALDTRTGEAILALAPGDEGASFEVGDLVVHGVSVDGVPASFGVAGGRLDVVAPPAATSVLVHYEFAAHEMFDGWDPSPGYSLLWPYFCKNLFPCDSRPVDGTSFTLDVTGVPMGETAVFPATIPAESPSYMPAVAVGAYTYVKLGDTTAGTEVGYYHLPGGAAAAATGTADLLAYVEFLESTLGAYTFGPKMASVAVPWPAGAYGGMEHHPYFHVGASAMGDKTVQAHEAAHGWFGNGIRMRCWEDFVLSEGLAEYLSIRAIEAAEGAMAADAEWAAEETYLMQAVASEDTLAWPTDACNSIDILNHPLWSSIPYVKGAFFMKAVEAQVGRAALDAALAAFYAEHAGEAAGMQDLIDRIEADTGADLGPLVTGWLRSMGLPADVP